MSGSRSLGPHLLRPLGGDGQCFDLGMALLNQRQHIGQLLDPAGRGLEFYGGEVSEPGQLSLDLGQDPFLPPLATDSEVGDPFVDTEVEQRREQLLAGRRPFVEESGELSLREEDTGGELIEVETERAPRPPG